MKSLIGVVAGVALLSGASSAQAARDFVWATGSSTVHPFALRVAENTTRKTGGKIAKIESTGTGGGFKSFCGGTGERFPDIANASRPMKKAEFEACNANGVSGVVELKIGLDGVVVAVDDKAPDYGFTVEQLYLGLAANSLRGGQFVANPFQTWKEVSPSLPAAPIRVYGPPPGSGTRDAFVELAIEAGAGKLPAGQALRAKDPAAFRAKVDPPRPDGAWTDAGENDNDIVETIERRPGVLGVFGYSFLAQNDHLIKAASISGVKPTPQTITNGSYPLSRALYIYVKTANLGDTPGLKPSSPSSCRIRRWGAADTSSSADWCRFHQRNIRQ